MEVSAASMQRLHNTHVGSESSVNFISSDLSSGPHCQGYHHTSIPSGFSFIIDDVDAEPESDRSGSEVSGTHVSVSDVSGSGNNLRCTTCQHEINVCAGGTCTDTNSAHSKEKSDARIQQIKGEAESRKNEFAKLLEEHAQVIKQLKQMEDEPAVSGGEAGPADVV